MVELVAELSKVRTEADAREALRAFIAVRRKVCASLRCARWRGRDHPEQLAAAIHALMLEDSEGGKRAQAACTEN
jgi:hypothetical protein